MQNLNIRLDAIVNDSSAAVLSRAYLDPSTRLAVILGTGLNAAIHLPISSLHPSKFGLREFPSTAVSHVLVNTELSLFGKRAFPTTRWDEHLNAHHMLPDYQPMEYLIAGCYMGEIVRLIIVEATETAGLFDGDLPSALSAPYTIDTHTLAAIEADTYPSLSPSCKILQEKYLLPVPPTPADMHFIRQVILSVSRRSQCYFTAAIYALSSLLHEMDQDNLNDGLDHISIGCDGSVINKYPGYMAKSKVYWINWLAWIRTGGRRLFWRAQERALSWALASLWLWRMRRTEHTTNDGKSAKHWLHGSFTSSLL